MDTPIFIKRAIILCLLILPIAAKSESTAIDQRSNTYAAVIDEPSLASAMDQFYSRLEQNNPQYLEWVSKQDEDSFAPRLGVRHSFKLGKLRLSENYYINQGILIYVDNQNNDMAWKVDMFTDLWILQNDEWRVIEIPRENIELGIDNNWLTKVSNER